eukprot:ANDGO_01880.mRNA.1 Uncharacterized protein C458.02c
MSTAYLTPEQESRKRELMAISRPEDSVFKTKLEAIEAEIAAFTKVIDQGKSTMASAKENKNSASSEVTDRKAAIAKIMERLNPLQETRERLDREVKAANEAKERIAADLQKKREALEGLKSEVEIDRQVETLEHQIESGNLSLPEEKKILQKISTLRKQKPVFAELAQAQKGLDAAWQVVKALQSEFNASRNAVNAVRDELKAAHNGLHEYMQKHKADLPNFETVIAKMNEAYEKRKEKQAERDALYKNHRSAVDAFFGAQKELSKIRDVEYRNRRAHENRERRRIEEEEQKTEMESNRKAQWLSEIEMCASLISFLENLSENSEKKEAEARKQRETHRALSKLEEQGYFIKKKGEPNKNMKKEIASAQKKSAAAAQQVPAPVAAASSSKEEAPASDTPAQPKEERKLVIPFEKLQAFGSLEVPAPVTWADVPVAIEAVKQKKTVFEGKREEAMKKLDEDLAKIALDFEKKRKIEEERDVQREAERQKERDEKEKEREKERSEKEKEREKEREARNKEKAEKKEKRDKENAGKEPKEYKNKQKKDRLPPVAPDSAASVDAITE